MSKPIISLIIPAYNEEKYLGACLESALKNGADNFEEIIVVDNASTDNTTQIAQNYLGVKVVKEEKKGLTKARERGFKEARGEILAYIDADTKMPPGWINLAVKEFAVNPNLAALSGPYVYYDSSSRQKLLVRLYWYAALPLYWLTGYMIVGGNFLIRKSVLAQMGGFNTTIEFYGEDTDIARRASRFGQVKFNLKLVMPTSARRLKGQGTLKTAWIYLINFLSQVILHKSATKKYADPR
ncbi:MAG: glycosyltransferase family A protein [bacterium]|nr:glycosyltransferase family A protein [bacterium]